MVVLSRRLAVPPGGADEVPSRTHAFDAGAAWGYLSLHAAEMGWSTHGMIGFDQDRVRALLGVPDEYALEAVVDDLQWLDPSSAVAIVARRLVGTAVAMILVARDGEVRREPVEGVPSIEVGSLTREDVDALAAQEGLVAAVADERMPPSRRPE